MRARHSNAINHHVSVVSTPFVCAYGNQSDCLCVATSFPLCLVVLSASVSVLKDGWDELLELGSEDDLVGDDDDNWNLNCLTSLRKSPDGTAKTCLTSPSSESLAPIMSPDSDRTSWKCHTAEKDAALEHTKTPTTPTSKLLSRFQELELLSRRTTRPRSKSPISPYYSLDAEESSAQLSMESSLGGHSTGGAPLVVRRPSVPQQPSVRIIGIPKDTRNHHHHRFTKMQHSVHSLGSDNGPNKLGRKLGYMPSMYNRERRRQKQQRLLLGGGDNHHSSDAASRSRSVVASTMNVFERLYYNEPRPFSLYKTPPQPKQYHYHHHKMKPKAAPPPEWTAAAARRLQAWWRMVVLRGEFAGLRVCAILLQSTIRGHQCRRVALQKNIMEQHQTDNDDNNKVLGGECQKQQQQQHQSATQQAAVMKLQSWWRMMVHRDQFLALRVCAVVLQAAGRGCLVRTRLRVCRKEQRDRNAAVIRIQAWWRMTMCRDEYETLRFCAEVIQATLRGFLVRRLIQETGVTASSLPLSTHVPTISDQKFAVAVTRIQRSWRRYVALTVLSGQHAAAAIIQYCVRTHQFQRKYLVERRESVIHARQQQRLANEETTSSRIKEGCVAAPSGAFDDATCSSLTQATVRRQLYNLRTPRERSSAPVHLPDSFSELEFVAAAIRIEAWWRMTLCREEYCTLRFCAEVAQATVRGHLVRRQLSRGPQTATSCNNKSGENVSSLSDPTASCIGDHEAAVAIQATIRRYLARNVYVCLQRIARALQTVYRAIIVRKLQVQKLVAATVIQRSWRRYEALSVFTGQYAAALLIQAAVRRRQCRRSCHRDMGSVGTALVSKNQQHDEQHGALPLKWIESTCVLQRWWRQQLTLLKQAVAATVLQSMIRRIQCRGKYSVVKRAAVSLQSFVRGRLACFTLHILRAATLLIQAATRGHLCRNHLVEKIGSAMAIQRIVRGHMSRSQLLSYQREIDAAQTLQLAWRSHRDRLILVDARVAATLIQASYRGSHRRKELSELNNYQTAAVVIQSQVRRLGCKILYQQARIASTYVQALFRGVQVRRRMQCLRVAARCIQRSWRRHHSALNMQTARSAASLIQATWRHFFWQQRFRLVVRSVVALQALFRLRSAQKKIEVTVHSATLIQTAWRVSLAKSALSDARIAASIIQAATRCRLSRKRYLEVKKMAQKVQSTLRHNSRVRRETKDRAVIVIQVSYRRYMDCFKLAEARAAAILIQGAWRGASFRQHRHSRNRAAIMIQALVRASCIGSFANSRRSAVLIQASARRFLRQKEYQLLRLAALTIQASIRCVQASRGYRKSMQAAIRIECEWRRCLGKCSLLEARAAATIIQSCWRACLCSKRYYSMRGAIALQRSWRRKSSLSRKKRESATVIQSAWLTSQALRTCAAATVIQACGRGYLSRTRALRGRAACLIQSVFRGHRSYVLFRRLHRSGLLIQSAVRRHNVEQQVMRFHAAASAIQRHWRGCACRHKAALSRAQGAFHKQTVAATLIQSTWRMYRPQCLLNDARISAALIQTCARGYLEKRRLLCEVAAGVLIQSTIRRHLSKSYLQQNLCAASIVQRQWRRSVLQRTSATCIQRLASRYLTSSARAARLKVRVVAAKKIQCSYRSRRMDLTLLKLTSSSVLLMRSVQGTLSRSTALYALLQINSCLRSNALDRYAEDVAIERVDAVALTSGWERAEERARLAACVLLQRYVRGYMCRLCLDSAVEGGSASPALGKAHAAGLREGTRKTRCTGRPGSPAVSVRVLEKVNKHCLRVELCAVTSFRRRRASRVIRYFLHNALRRKKQGTELLACQPMHPETRRTGDKAATERFFTTPGGNRSISNAAAGRIRRPGSPAVSVRVLEQINGRRLRVELCAETKFRQNRAARVVQAFARAVRANEEAASQRRLIKSLMVQLGQCAEKEVASLLVGYTPEESTPCLVRLAERTRQALDLSSCQQKEGCPSVRLHNKVTYGSAVKLHSPGMSIPSRRNIASGLESLLSPIKPTQEDNLSN